MANLIYRTTGRLLRNNVHNYRFSTQYNSPFLNNRRFYSKKNAVPKYFTKKHEWITVEGNIGTVGITDYAEKSLGDIVFVQLPKVGADLNTEDECGALESVKAASELYSPVSGTVTKINEALEQKPELINEDCYDEGWLFKLTLKNPEELNQLLKEKEYKEFIISDQFNLNG